MGTKNYSHQKLYGPFKGIHKGISQIDLPAPYMTQALNCFVQPGSTALTSRTGYKPTGLNPSTSDKKYFAGLYVETDTSGNQYEREVLINGTDYTVDVVKEVTVSIANTTGAVVYAEVSTNSSGFGQFRLLDNGLASLYTLTLDSAMGVPSVTVSTLVSGIDALSNITCTNTGGVGGSSFASVVFPALYEAIPNGATRELKGYYISTTAASTAVQTAASSFTGGSAQAISYTNLNNILYCALPSVGLCKWDGVAFYKAGVPKPSPITAAVSNNAATGGGPVTGYYQYAIAYEKIDAKGNVLEGLGESSRAVSGGSYTASGSGPGMYEVVGGVTGRTLNITVPTLEDASDYDARGAIINGNQNLNSGNLIITVNSGHSLRIGDWATFQSNSPDPALYPSVLVIDAIVTATTATTVTISSTGMRVTRCNGTLVSVKNGTTLPAFAIETDVTMAQLVAIFTNVVITSGQAISNGLHINLYRTAVSASLSANYGLLYLDQIVPNNCFASSTTAIDGRDSTSLALCPLWEQKTAIGPEQLELSAGTAPVCTIVHNHQSRLYIAGLTTTPNVLDRSDVLWGPEYYDPAGSAQLNLETRVASVITAIGSAGDNVVVGKSRGIKLISGDLGTDVSIKVEDISFELGIQNQASTVSGTETCMALTQLGPIEISGSGTYQYVGSGDLQGKSRLEGALKNASLDLRYASAAVNAEKGYYILFLPIKGSSGTSASAGRGFSQFDTGSTYAQLPEKVTSQTNMGTAYVYIMNQDSWFEWDSFAGTGGLYVKGGRLHAAVTGNTLGTVLLQENLSGKNFDYVDWIRAISWQPAFNWETLGEAAVYKQFLRILLQNVETDTLSSTQPEIFIRTDKDWSTNTNSSFSEGSIAAAASSTAWRGLLKIKGNKSRSMRIRLLSGTINTRPIVSGLTFEAAAPFKPKLEER
jgi:hypothetical protein